MLKCGCFVLGLVGKVLLFSLKFKLFADLFLHSALHMRIAHTVYRVI